MSVKIITSDAKGHFTKFLAEFENSERIRDMFISSNKKASETAWKIRKQIVDVKGLSPWISDTQPTLIKTPNTGADGSWNGGKLANIKIRGKLFLFKNALFDVNGFYSEEEAKLVVIKKYQKERSKIDFLQSRKDEESEAQAGREHIPERIRNEVWRRDNGKCVDCGSVYKLEFDHVIPIAKGGSNTARNLRILCEPCNRRKSDQIG